MTGQLCPECDTPRAAEGQPGCFCAGRAARAAQAGRTAEIAASEDFDPLRIRPYVTLDEAGREAPVTFRTAGPLPALAPEAGPAGQPSAEPRVSVRAAGPLRPEPAPARRKSLRAVAIGAATVAVIGTAAFGASLFPGSDQQDMALPDEGHTGMPEGNLLEPDASLVTSSAAPSASPFVSTAPTATGASGAPPGSTPAASTTSNSTAPTEAGTPASPAPGATAPARPGDPAVPPRAPAAPVLAPVQGGSPLSRGDSGAEVVTLQNRLAEMRLFHGRADGRYDERVEIAVRVYQTYRRVDGDAKGVYGPHTRRALESETKGRGRRH
ncbi:peptidoglycan-binding protein [Streptomyces sp. NPDC051569]|uniref:peptidoglycan-binding domain-containing protein n=1 Tax=Streptomyces sp. NPDC051569 TaxID=3365661 RepID=UPI00379D1F2A